MGNQMVTSKSSEIILKLPIGLANNVMGDKLTFIEMVAL